MVDQKIRFAFKLPKAFSNATEVALSKFKNVGPEWA